MIRTLIAISLLLFSFSALAKKSIPSPQVHPLAAKYNAQVTVEVMGGGVIRDIKIEGKAAEDIWNSLKEPAEFESIPTPFGESENNVKVSGTVRCQQSIAAQPEYSCIFDY